MTMTSEPTTSTRATVGALTDDGQTLPPFLVLDELDAELERLDSWVSTFIGRMQPYSVPAEGTLLEGMKEDPGAQFSTLEKRVIEQRRRITNLIHSLDAMNSGLRL